MTAALLSPAGNSIARLIRRGASWWVGELRQMMPRHVANLLGKRTESGAVLRIGASDASLLLPDRGRPSRIMIPLTGEQPEEQLRSAIKGTRRGDVVTIAVTHPTIDRRITLAWRPGSTSPAARAFITLAREHLGQRAART